MARSKTAGLTDAELRLMEVLWEKGTATVSDVVEALPKNVPLAYSTVLTTLRHWADVCSLEHGEGLLTGDRAVALVGIRDRHSEGPLSEAGSEQRRLSIHRAPLGSSVPLKRPCLQNSIPHLSPHRAAEIVGLPNHGVL